MLIAIFHKIFIAIKAFTSMKFSGSSGVRMVWGEELLNLAYQIGMSMGNEYDDIAIASDFRVTSDPIVSMIAGGIMASGASVYYGGKVPTPTLAYATKNHDAGLMITASHNPPEYNGIKLWNPDGSAFSDEQIEKLQGRNIAKWSKVGRFFKENMLGEHRKALLKEFKAIDLNVVIDCSNGAGSVLTPLILRDLGTNVSTLNCHPSGRFPGHPSEPSKENLMDLKNMVMAKKADLGIAHDGDADRFVAITSSGRYLNGDLILAIFAKVLGYERIVAPVDSSRLLENFAEVIRCKVGDANVSRVMREKGIEFGGENSGTQIFASWRYTPDAIYGALKFAEIAAREDIDALLQEFPIYHTLRKNIYYKNREEMEQKIENFVKDYPVQRVDGYRVDFDDGWFLIRFSGTEPKVRITVEFESQELASIWMSKIYQALSK